jgi:hypothetical protein
LEIQGVPWNIWIRAGQSIPFTSGEEISKATVMLQAIKPKNSIFEYETAIKSDKLVLVVHGSADEITKAKDALKNMGHDVQVHSA